MTCLVNPAADAAPVPGPVADAASFHASLAGYAPTPLRALPAVAAELGLASVAVKDESDRIGLPSFKVLGASWAVERALRERPSSHTLVAASAGNHGRAVAHVAALRGLRCRVFLPERSAPVRREAIAGEGAEVVVVDGDYEEAVARSARAGAEPDVIEVADVGVSATARWVVDGYATLFDEAAAQGEHDLVVVPVGVGSLAAAAARWAAASGARVLAVEPERAACLTASLRTGRPTTVTTPEPGTIMAGMDCAEVSETAWPSLSAGIHGAVTVDDAEADAAVGELADAGMTIGPCGAATLAALRRLVSDAACGPLREALGLGPGTRVLLLGTEGRTDVVA